MTKKISFYLLTEKGYRCLEGFINAFGAAGIEHVVVGKDNQIQKDFYKEIKELCTLNNIKVFERTEEPELLPDIYGIAISWRWMIKSNNNLIILHDSLLPKYRGFNPLVTCLINGDPETGVTAIFAHNEYDCGPVISQKSIKLTYPLQISRLIKMIIPLYVDVVKEVGELILSDSLTGGEKQNENQATYSLWRDEEDYFIDWSQDSRRIKRFIDAVGYPYAGAQSHCNGQQVKILDCEVIDDVKIENRIPGKVIFVKNNCPVVVCGTGLLSITSIQDMNGISLLPLTKFRTRFN